jgi:hypothetical protein
MPGKGNFRSVVDWLPTTFRLDRDKGSTLDSTIMAAPYWSSCPNDKAWDSTPDENT